MTIVVVVVVFFLSEFEMSDEIKSSIDEENNQTEETLPEVSTIEDEENEPPLSTPNGRESPSAVSFSDVIIEKKEEEPPAALNDNHVRDLVQIISEKSNEEASSTILNTVRRS